MRTVRSFDPCLPCGVHMFLGDGMTLKTTHSPCLERPGMTTHELGR
jgi:hydrogenase large subunit